MSQRPFSYLCSCSLDCIFGRQRLSSLLIASTQTLIFVQTVGSRLTAQASVQLTLAHGDRGRARTAWQIKISFEGSQDLIALQVAVFVMHFAPLTQSQLALTPGLRDTTNDTPAESYIGWIQI
jgi:hypothetical protein